VPIEGCGKADLVFILDSSASIGEKNWWVTKQFAIDVTRGLVIDGVKETKVGAVTYSNYATTHFDLGVFTSYDDIEDAIWGLDWESGVTNTYDGLSHAEQIYRRSCRDDVKHIVVLITDGVSNVKKDLTVPKAEEMHSNGIEIFVVGIGKVDMDEITGICSIPKDFHCHYVTSYQALVAITNTVINDTCKAANLTECDEWSEWSTDCILRDQVRQCGAGDYIRTRECRFYLWEGGDSDIRIHTEKRPCDGPPCPTTIPPPEPECTWTECSVSCGGGERICDRGNGKTWTIACNMQSCDPVLDCGEADVAFLLDSSASIGERNWWMTKQFAIDVSKGLAVGPGKIHIGAVSFSRRGEVQWGVDDSRAFDPALLETSLWDLPWRKKTTFTAEGLELVRETALGGSRNLSNRVVIVMTDGKSNVHPSLTIPMAQTLHDAGLQVFCIVVRETGSPEFDAIASHPTTTYLHNLRHYDSLSDITDTITGQTCLAARGLLV